MNKLLTAIAATTCTLAAAAASFNDITSEIAPFVYPANKPLTAGEMQFMPDGETYLAAAGSDRIVSYETRSGKEVATVLDCTHTREASIASFDSFVISPDGSKLLLATDTKSIYRRSSTAVWYVYDIKRNILRRLSDEHPRQQAPLFSPDARSVAFVADNNIFIKKLNYNSEVAVTKDGEPGKLINGVPDWSYEEEFDTTCSMAWAPDSQTLCYLTYDESRVPSYTLPIYEGTCEPQKQYALYPGAFTYKYPVAGEHNSVVALKSYDLSTRKIKDLDLPDHNIEYIPRIIYTSSAETLLAVTLNREQTRMEIYAVNPKSTIVHSLLVEESKAWLSPLTYENITLTDKSVIIHSGRSGYNHLYEYSLTGVQLRTLTSGNYDVTACYGADADGAVYYQAADRSPLDRSVVRLDAKGKTTVLGGADGGTASATFSPLSNYAVINYSDAVTPPVYKLITSAGKELRTIQDNADMRRFAASIPQKEFFTLTSDGVTLNGYMIRPEDFNPSQRYPVIMWQYSGPGSQQVLNKWMLDWDYYAATRGFIVVCVDGRGTGARGRDFETIVYRNLGHYETIDQLATARYVGSLPYVDAKRIGIAGWSYGGYETLMCVGRSSSTFAAAVAIAPVTDWRYYDTIYTERYMLTPRANEDGYRTSAPINLAADVDCRLLLMYGTSDDNVHPANTLEYVSRLQAAGHLCDMLVFPNMNHSINGCNARSVVYGKMVEYFLRNMR